MDQARHAAKKFRTLAQLSAALLAAILPLILTSCVGVTASPNSSNTPAASDPPATQGPVISGVSAGSITATAATVAWTTSSVSTSQVSYGTTTSYGQTAGPNGASVTSHTIPLSSLAASTLYHYEVTSVDASGNQAASSDFTFTTTAAAAPVIGAVASSGITTTSATITWTTRVATSSQVNYGATTAYGQSSTLNSTLATSHSVALSGLTAGTTYHYQVVSVDASGNKAASADFTLVTVALPAISNVASSAITTNAATITWTTNVVTSSQVKYGTTTAYGQTSTLNSALVTSHSVALSSLTAGTTYHYQVVSIDGFGNQTASADATFATAALPAISSVSAASIASTGATIAWTTNVTTTSQVKYGTTTAYGQNSTLNSALATSHSVALSGLTASTTYHFQVISTDANGNTVTSADSTFTTTAAGAPVISAVAASGITTSAATIGWTTNVATTSQVNYGTTTAYGQSSTLNSSLVTSHSVSLSGLTASTLYHYQVVSVDSSGNTATSSDFTFTTSALPAISAVSSSAVTSSGAAITWTTNVATSSQVNYGTTVSYGQSSTLNSSLVTSHSVSLSGLTASTLYHYQVVSKDSSGNTATSSDFTFTTSALPAISAVGSSAVTSSGATITWTTNVATSSQLNYGTTASYGQSSTLNSSLATSHAVTLTGLTASTLYHYQAVSTDANGNRVNSGDFTFTTSAATLPTISGMSAASISSASATIVWTTNTSTTSEVDYGTTTSYGQKLTNSTLVTSHSEAITGLTASTLYHYRVQSTDASGNTATASDSTFTTAAASSGGGSTGCPSTTAIGNLGCSLAAGSWVQVPNSAMSGWSSGNVLRPSSGGSVTEFADKAQWNPINNTFMFLGGSHVTNKANCDATLFVSYTDSTNTWSNTNLNSPCPNDIGGFGGYQNLGHAYEDDTIDPATGNYFYREYGSVDVFMYSQASQSWSQLPNFESSCASGSSCTEGGLEWFPDRNSLVLVDGTAGIFECVFSGSNSNGTPCASWTQLACTAFTCSGIPRYNQMGPYQNIAIYSPLCQCIIAGGGGSTFIVAYQANGTFRTLGAAPFTLDTADSQGGNAWVRDPVSGNFVVLDSACNVWTYNPSGDAWTNTGGKAPQCPTAENGVANIVTAPVSTYGVMMFVYQGSAGSNGSVYLYRYASGSGTTQTNPPTASVTAPTSGSTVSGSTTVTASATSTAGIASVQFQVDAISSGAPVTTSPYTMNWNTASASNGTHTLTAVAQDTLGNTTTSAGVSVTVSNGSTGSGGTGGSAADADFQSRCTATGVFLCNALVQPSDITGNWGGVQGNCCAGNTPMAIDTNVYPANGGSMVCAIPANSTGDDPCSDFFQNFSATKTLSFSDNSTFYIQMEMWMDAAYLADKPANGEGQKQFILSSGDPSSCTTSSTSTCQTSCTYAEIVMLNNSYRGNPSGIPQLYQNCGDYAPMSTSISTSWNPDNFTLQNNMPSPYCVQYLNPTSGQPGSSYFPPYGNCAAYPTGQWYSVELEVSLGAYNTTDQSYDNSTVNLWIAPVGQAYQQPFNYKMNIHDQSHLGYGKIWLLTYNTGATSWAGNYNIRWAELIGSTNFIPAPQH